MNREEIKLEEVNAILRQIAYDDGISYERIEPVKKILIGSGEDCQVVLFGELYKNVR